MHRLWPFCPSACADQTFGAGTCGNTDVHCIGTSSGGGALGSGVEYCIGACARGVGAQFHDAGGSAGGGGADGGEGAAA